MCVGNQRPHAHALDIRIADDRLFEPGGNCLQYRIDAGFLHDDAPDRGAFLARLDSDLAHHFLDEAVEVRASRRCIRPKQRGIEAVLFGGEPHRFFQQARMASELQCRRGRACEGHRILAIEQIEQIAGRAADKLYGPFRQQAAFDHHRKTGMGQVGGRRCRLDDCRNTGKQRRCQLFQHAPDRKVVGIDVNGNALQRHTDMLANKGSVP